MASNRPRHRLPMVVYLLLVGFSVLYFIPTAPLTPVGIAIAGAKTVLTVLVLTAFTLFTVWYREKLHDEGGAEQC